MRGEPRSCCWPLMALCTRRSRSGTGRRCPRCAARSLLTGQDLHCCIALLQRQGAHDLGYIGPGTFEHFPILDRADPDLPGTAHCFGGPYVQDRAPFPPHARQEVRPADPPLCTAQPALLLTLQPQVPGRPRRPAPGAVQGDASRHPGAPGRPCASRP